MESWEHAYHSFCARTCFIASGLSGCENKTVRNCFEMNQKTNYSAKLTPNVLPSPSQREDAEGRWVRIQSA